MVGGHQGDFPKGSGSWRSLRAHCGSQGCDRPHGQDFLSSLSAGRGRSCPHLPDLLKLLFFISTNWNPFHTCLGSLQSTPKSFPKEILHTRAATQADAFCFFLREWHDRNPSLPGLPPGNDSCFLEAIRILALLTHQGISLYLSQLQVVQPQYCTAAITGQTETETWTSLFDGWPDTAFPCSRAPSSECSCN